ncbi:hypothetical protein M407DRAFT_25219 [Tulasnella calospora MUT 4182]|uniref:Uncharacterized protein n=1 Tax=Tulasnella calospora MUT 4182 TaxID=1051891 RepID=A0A0C3QGG9_9AGAM|nr:hypothetical protein M407DRAFT_25219 [Tulasnella calospora MUT 4182]
MSSPKSQGKRSTRTDAQSAQPSNEYTLYVQVRLRPRQGSSIISIRRREDKSIADAEIAVGARPIDGQANEELVEYLRDVTKVPKSDIQIVKGTTTSKQKVIHLQSCNEDPFERMALEISQA